MRDKSGVLRTKCTVVFHVEPSAQCECREYMRPSAGSRCESCGHGATFHEKGSAVAPQWDSDEEDVAMDISDDDNEAAAARPATADAAQHATQAESKTTSTPRPRRRKKKKAGLAKQSSRRLGSSRKLGSSKRLMRSPITGGSQAWTDSGSVGGKSTASRRSRRLGKSATTSSLRGTPSGEGGVVSTTQPRRVFAKEDVVPALKHVPSKRLTRSELQSSVSRLAQPREVPTDSVQYERVGGGKKIKKEQLEKSLSRLLLRPER